MAKIDQAIQNVRNKENGEQLAKPMNAASLVTMATPEELAQIEKDLASGDWDSAPQMLDLAKGQVLYGILEGNGIPAEFERVDKMTGIVTTNSVDTWIIRSLVGNVRVSILSSAQLDKKLPGYVGGPVKIVRGDDVNFTGGRYTDYLVLGPKRADGSIRDWSGKTKLLTAAPTETQS